MSSPQSLDHLSEVNPWNPHCEEREHTPKSCPSNMLHGVSMDMPHTCAHVCAHTQIINLGLKPPFFVWPSLVASSLTPELPGVSTWLGLTPMPAVSRPSMPDISGHPSGQFGIGASNSCGAWHPLPPLQPSSRARWQMLSTIHSGRAYSGY